ncbi:MAG: hypothetical protein AAFR35_15465 [Pseudomonadota bacterium]
MQSVLTPIVMILVTLGPPAFLTVRAGAAARRSRGGSRLFYRVLSLIGIVGFAFNLMLVAPGEPLVQAPAFLMDMRYVVGLSLVILPFPLWYFGRMLVRKPVYGISSGKHFH